MKARKQSPRAIRPAPRQLLLDIHPEHVPTLDNFVVGDNRELVARLAALADHDAFDQIYLWGAPGSGRTHLLRGALAMAQERGRPICFVEGARLGEDLAPPPGSLIIIDDVHLLDATGQMTLFRIFNAARLVGLALLLSGSEPPLRLAETLREDLRTRIGNALIYEVHALDDAAKAAALRRHADGRGLRIDDALIGYLLHHGRRDLPSLLASLDALDRTSLEQRRPPTLPLLREMLQTSIPPTDSDDTNHGPGTV